MRLIKSISKRKYIINQMLLTFKNNIWFQNINYDNFEFEIIERILLNKGEKILNEKKILINKKKRDLFFQYLIIREICNKYNYEDYQEIIDAPIKIVRYFKKLKNKK